MAKLTHAQWNLDSTANELIALHPGLRGFFDDLGIDDCCLELNLRTIASHTGTDEEKICEMIWQACKSEE